MHGASLSKASVGRRKRRFERRGGRPTGSYKSLLTDPQRFSIATWLTLEPIYGPHVAARAAAVWIEERTPITLEFVKGLLRMISANYKEPTSAKASKSRGPRRLRQPARNLDGYASQLADKARLMTARATEHEFAWLTQSSGALFALMKFIIASGCQFARDDPACVASARSAYAPQTRGALVVTNPTTSASSLPCLVSFTFICHFVGLLFGVFYFDEAKHLCGHVLKQRITDRHHVGVDDHEVGDFGRNGLAVR